MLHEYQHDWKPTHNPRRSDVVAAEEEAAWCWKRLDEHLDTRNGEHYEPEWWDEHRRLTQAANEAEKWVDDLRYQALNECSCYDLPDGRQYVCPVCLAQARKNEMEF